MDNLHVPSPLSRRNIVMSIGARQRPAGRPTPPSWRVITNPDIGPGVRTPAPIAPSGPAFRTTVAIFKLLIKHFSEETKLYEPDWNDERVAGESGAHLAYVVALRCKHYGELAVPAAVEQ